VPVTAHQRHSLLSGEESGHEGKLRVEVCADGAQPVTSSKAGGEECRPGCRERFANAKRNASKSRLQDCRRIVMLIAAKQLVGAIASYRDRTVLLISRLTRKVGIIEESQIGSSYWRAAN